jgi:hypothetical protein
MDTGVLVARGLLGLAFLRVALWRSAPAFAGADG